VVELQTQNVEESTLPPGLIGPTELIVEKRAQHVANYFLSCAEYCITECNERHNREDLPVKSLAWYDPSGRYWTPRFVEGVFGDEVWLSLIAEIEEEC
jgi:hypothetical protein